MRGWVQIFQSVRLMPELRILVCAVETGTWEENGPWDYLPLVSPKPQDF